MIQFEPVDIIVLKNMRMNYFYEIKLSQELFLEWEVQNRGQYYRICVDDVHEAGYFILNKDGVMLEFYLAQEYLTRKEEIFSKALQNYSIRKVYCKTFDSILLICSQSFSRSARIMSTIFRDYFNGASTESDSSIRIRLATEADISRLLSYDSGLYETPEELRYTVSNRMVYMFEKENSLIGCGYLIKILPDKNYYDIGMWVNPDFRNEGYAAMIISHLKKLCFSHGYIPVCGCRVDNVASRKTLEKTGFVSKHAIIEFDVSYRQFHI